MEIGMCVLSRDPDHSPETYVYAGTIVTWTGQGELEILRLVFRSVVDARDSGPMDHIPMFNRGGKADDQWRPVARDGTLEAKERNAGSLSVVQPYVRVHLGPVRIEEEERFTYQEINAVL
jgi:hypothetical protein